MANNSQQSIFRILILTIIPMFFGSLLFAAILESYKNDIGDNKDLVKTYYSPMRIFEASCSSQHNQLFLKHNEIIGSNKLLFDELIELLSTNFEKNENYHLVPKAVLESNKNLSTEIKNIERHVRKCRIELLVMYEELALITGTYNEFLEFSENRDEEINQIYKSREKQLVENVSELKIKPEELFPFFKKLISNLSKEQLIKTDSLKKIKSMYPAIEKHRLILARTEQKIYFKEQSFFKSLRSLFANEISQRNSQGFFGWFF